MEKTYNLVELFSGIGSQAKALKNIGIKIGNTYTCEWDIHAFVAYDAIHHANSIPQEIQHMDKKSLLIELERYGLSNNGKEPMKFSSLKTYSEQALKRIYASIKRTNNFVDVNALTGDRIPEDIDILTYSFPCQDLSNVGAFHGYNKGIDKDSGSRSSLLWQVGRVLEEMRCGGKKLPRFLLLENVPALLAERHFGNFKTWIGDLENLGYVSAYYLLNASSFGLPQNRPRLLMLSVYVGEDTELKEKIIEYFASKSPETIVDDYKKSPYYNDIKINELLRIDYKNHVLFEEACECTPNDTISRRKIWEENPQFVLADGKINPKYDVVRTITTKQDRHPNSGNLYFESGIEGRANFRYLTPRECLLFMGFSDEDYENIVEENPDFHKGSKLFPRDKIIRMAGNSIPVKLLEGIFYQVKKIDEMISK